MLVKIMYKLAVTTLLLMWPLLGWADPIVFSSGAKGGGYWSAASRLKGIGVSKGLEVQVEESPGSLHNLARLLDNNDPTSLVLAQADALQHYLIGHPGQSEKIEILENIGQECVFIITAGDSPVDTDEDLQQASDYQLAIGSPDSGVAFTFTHMTTLLPELGDITVQYEDTSGALNKLNSASAGGADAVMVVHRPKEFSPELDLALRNPDQFDFVQISDNRLEAQLPDGETVYKSLKLAVPVPDSEEKREITTICVKGLLVANKEKMTEQQRTILGELVDAHWMQVYATER